MSTASNIKSKTVRKDVISALKSSMYLIKAYKKSEAPKNGLVIYAGDIENKSYV